MEALRIPSAAAARPSRPLAAPPAGLYALALATNRQNESESWALQPVQHASEGVGMLA